MEIQGNELIIECPKGMEIDKENSTFECIKFKPINSRWRDNEYLHIDGYYINLNSNIMKCTINYLNIHENYNIFATEKQAKSALAMARISQIMANDNRFGGVITDEEWYCCEINKYVLIRWKNAISLDSFCQTYYFLAFHTKEQADLFLEENEDLVRDYLML